jgi:phosphoserine phosphatase RsbU/P
METSAAKPQPIAAQSVAAQRAGASVATVELDYLRSELEQRRDRLQSALQSSSGNASLSSLLTEVDAALARMEEGTFGICEACHDPIEKDRLLADPLVRICLTELSNEEQRALESDLALAASIQRALLPPTDFAAKGWDIRYHYAPAGVVSGDYCDLLQSKDGVLFVLGDVSGKGVAASMLMSHLHATFHSLADTGLPLNRMVEAANRVFSGSTLAGQFATLVVGRLSPNGWVEFVNAGHLPPLHLRDGEVQRLPATGVPLGMFRNSDFEVQRLSLERGEALLLYTDGLTEASNSGGEEYGIQRVKTVASRHCTSGADTIIGQCLSDWRSFSADGKQKDDLTILALRRTL